MIIRLLAVLILGTTLAAKVYSLGDPIASTMREPVFGVSFITFVTIAGLAEALLILILIWPFDSFVHGAALTTFGATVGVYRVWMGGAQLGGEICPCLGTLSNSVEFLAAYGEQLLSATGMWFLVVGIYMLQDQKVNPSIYGNKV